MENKVNLLESQHDEELVAHEQNGAGEKVTDGFPNEGCTSNLELSLENKCG